MEAGGVAGPPQYGGDNRRRHPRHPLRLAGTAWILERVKAPPFAVEATDVSASGMMLHGSSSAFVELVPGDGILVGFPLPHSKERVSVKGKLAWKRMGLMAIFGEWSFGIEFHATPEDDIRKLTELAERQREQGA